MKALLDTNIVIHRENTKVTNQSIGLLFYWLDRLHYEKMIHQYSMKELNKYCDQQMLDLYGAKLSSYTEMKTIAVQDAKFIELLKDVPKSENDVIDNQLLCEVYLDRVDILITEDRKMRNKAQRVGIYNRVFSINTFVEKCTCENPALVNYNALSVKKEFIGNIDINNIFFNSLRKSYKGFDKWFAGKSNEEAYICFSENKKILGFLYLKSEEKNHDYSNITPCFESKKRLKVGTFKIESTGFRLGERFIKIIFDNAIEQKVDEIYVTMFSDREELKGLYELLLRWGFKEYGIKESENGKETVLTKEINTYRDNLSIKQNYPNIDYSKAKRILPIYAKYHTTLLPDSQLKTENEINFIGTVPHRYALQKVYITWGIKNDVKSGDIILFYRIGDSSPKKYSSVLTSVCVVDEIISDFSSKEEYMDYCQNRSVFSKIELENFWNTHRYNLCIVKFIYVKSLTKKLTLGCLWDLGIVIPPNGPRSFERITDEQFCQILDYSNTSIYKEKMN